MLSWLKKSPANQVPARQHAAIRTLIDAAWNSAAMTWQNLFGVLNHERLESSRTDAALRLSAVKCALDIYTGMVGSVPRRMYAVDSVTQEKLRIVGTTDHPASRLFSHYFNPELSADEALLLIVYDVLMDGNCYFLREYDAQGRTARLYYIHPSRIPRANIVRAQGSEKLSTGRNAAVGELIYRIDSGVSYRDRDAQPIIVSKADIVHFKGKVLDAEHHRGQGFVSNSLTSLDLYRASEEFGWKFYSRGIATQMFLTTDNRLAPEVLKRLEANFQEDPNAPLEDIFRTRILEQGLKPVHMGIPFQHLQFIETRAFSVEDVARGLTIPPALLHSYMGTKAGDADLAQATSLFIQTGIGPLLSRLANQFRTELLPLPSQMLFTFEFELLYLYRNVIDKFSASLRNLFEIGILDRTESRALLGLHINPSDAAANPRYVPVNLMTVEHSLLLQEQARLSNETATKNLDMLDAQIEGAQKANAGMVPAEAAESNGDSDDSTSESDSRAADQPDMDKSPSSDNIDKRLRKATNVAFMNVINGLRQYETRVLDQKRQSRPDDYEAAVAEFYAADGKFAQMLNEQLDPWEDVLQDISVPTSPRQIAQSWLSSQKSPEGIEHELACTES